MRKDEGLFVDFSLAAETTCLSTHVCYQISFWFHPASHRASDLKGVDTKYFAIAQKQRISKLFVIKSFTINVKCLDTIPNTSKVC